MQPMLALSCTVESAVLWSRRAHIYAWEIPWKERGMPIEQHASGLERIVELHQEIEE